MKHKKNNIWKYDGICATKFLMLGLIQSIDLGQAI